MKILLLLCCCAIVACQTKGNSGTTFGEFGSPAFDEIVVHSTLTVKGKSASRGAKALVSDTKTKTVPLLNTNATAAATPASASLTLKRNKRVPRRYSGSGFQGFPGLSSSSAQASSNSFNHNTPFGSFGASSSQSASQSQNFGPNGFQASLGHSASQSYRLPNGNSLDVSFSGGFSSGSDSAPSFSNSHSITLTKPNGQQYRWRR